MLVCQAGRDVKTARATVLQDLTWLAYIYCSNHNIKIDTLELYKTEFIRDGVDSHFSLQFLLQSV